MLNMPSIVCQSRVPFIRCDAQGIISDYNQEVKDIFGGVKAMRDYFSGRQLRNIFQQLANFGEPVILESVIANGKGYDLIINPYPAERGGIYFSVLLCVSDPWERWAEGDNNIHLMVQEIIDCIADGIIVVDAAGYVRQINNSYRLMVDIKTEEYKDKHVQQLQDQGYTHTSLTPLVVERNQPVTIVDVRNNKDLLLTGVPIRNKQDEIIGVICNVRDVSELQGLKRKLEKSKENERLFQEQLSKFAQKQDETIISNNKKMQQIFELAIKIASLDSSVLILGESGVGKGLLAETIHKYSNRGDKPFVTVNCGAIPESLIESELFGYEAGAFTGASKGGKKGLFEQAEGGTIFLDEVGELPLNMQVKLLQTVQESTVRRVGGKKSIRLDIRIISATNRDLKQMVQQKEFREDLYYRLNVVPIHLPPLRERKEDIIPLAMMFLKRLNEKYALKKEFSAEAMRKLLQNDWPGNIRELENTVERLLVTSDGDEISLPEFLGVEARLDIEYRPLKEILGEMEKSILEEAYKRTSSSRKSSAMLGISQSTFVKKAKKYGIALTGAKK